MGGSSSSVGLRWPDSRRDNVLIEIPVVSERAEMHLPTPQGVLDSLELDPMQWHVESLESPEREAMGPDGQSAMLTDSVLSATRLTN